MFEAMACNKLLSEFENGIKIFENAASKLDAERRRLNEALKSYIPTNNFIIPHIDLPDADDYDRLMAIIQACLFFKNHPRYHTSEGLINSCYGQLNCAINAIYGAGLEFALTFMIDDFNFGIKGFDLANLVPNLDGIINCLSVICDQDVQNKIDRVNNLVEGIGLNEDGTINKDDLYSQIPGAGAQEQLKNCVDTVKTRKDDIASSIGIPPLV